MTAQNPKIVVVTPVKNEAWILERFLAITSRFADLIIVADQASTDGSVEICRRYPKVTLIQNNSEQYDEASRQILLIQAARELVPEHKIILALDADEVLAANALETLGWQAMLKARPGTVLYFEKPDLYLTPQQCIRYSTPWPLGYVDDGAEHKPKKIHSIRIPIPEYSLRLFIHDVKVLHYALTRMDVQASKRRMYCVIENVSKTLPSLTRRVTYLSNTDWTKQGRLEVCPKDWFEAWEELEIDMTTIQHQLYYWYDYEVLSYFYKYGLCRFWFDDIWNYDWEKCRLHAKSIGINYIPEYNISKPPRVINFSTKLLDKPLLYIREQMKK